MQPALAQLGEIITSSRCRNARLTASFSSVAVNDAFGHRALGFFAVLIFPVPTTIGQVIGSEFSISRGLKEASRTAAATR